MKMRNMLVMAKAQTALGTEATLTPGSNAMLTRSAGPSLIKGDFVARNLIRPFMGNSPTVLAGQYRTLDMEIELAGAGTAGTAPAFDPLLLGCGMSKTTTAGTSVVYQPVTSGDTYVTLIAILDGTQFKLTDALGTVKFEMNPKGIPVMKYTFTGVYSPAADVTMPTGINFASFMDPLTVGRVNTPTFTLFGFSPAVEQFSFDLGNQIVWRELLNKGGASRTDRKPTATALIEMTNVATKNWGELVRLSTTGALQVVHGVTAGNIVQVDMPKVSVSQEPSTTDSNGEAMLNLTLNVNPNAGNDELLLTFK